MPNVATIKNVTGKNKMKRLKFGENDYVRDHLIK